MKLSVIIPAYNAEKILHKAFETAYLQDIDPVDFEVIIVDDGSSDSTFEVANKCALLKQNCTILQQENKGLGGARNSGIQAAKGEYICFLDADDFLISGSMGKLLALAEQMRLDVLEFGARGIRPNGQTLYVYTNESEKVKNGLDYYQSIRYMNSACNKLYNRSFLLANQLFFLEQIFIEDYEFNTRVFTHAKRVYATSILGAEFVQSDNSITRNTDAAKRQKMITDIFQVIQIINKEYRASLKSENQFLNAFYLERLNFLVVTLFYQLFKMNSSLAQCIFWKKKLKEAQMWYVKETIYDWKKNQFKFLLIYFPLFLITVYFKRITARLFSKNEL